MELFITRYGARIHVKDGVFEISWFDDDKQLHKETHSPKVLKSLWVQDGSVISAAAHLLALTHQIDLVIMDRYSMPQGSFQGFELHSTPLVQKAQVIISVGAHAVDFVRQWLGAKLQHQATFLESLKLRRDDAKGEVLKQAAQEIKGLRRRLLAVEGLRIRDVADTLRGLEGAAGQVYFRTLSNMLPLEQQFGERSRRPAKDPFNAFLNYGIMVLYSKVEQALRLAGINPYIGFLHRDGYLQKSMLFDYIEPFRIWVEGVVFRLFSRKMANGTHTEARDGGLQLNVAGIQLLMTSLKEFLDKKAEAWDGALVSRTLYLRKAAFSFASRLQHLAQVECN